MLVGGLVSGNRCRKGELIRYKCPDRDNQRVTTVKFVMVGRRWGRSGCMMLWCMMCNNKKEKKSLIFPDLEPARAGAQPGDEI